jgi:thiosulfate/3-mercaptopyruvate sulfurtransferase
VTPILIELADLEGLPAPVQFVDTRIGADYRRGHIPGALHLDTFPYANESTDSERWPQVVADWRKVFSGAGLHMDETVVFYDGGLENRAARNGFMLRYLGHPNAHVLHGGMTAWVRSGGASFRKPNVREPAALEELSLRDEMVALVADVERAVSEGGPLLLDVRDTGEFEGRVRLQWNPRMGRIPGAVPLEWTTLLTFEDVDRALVGTPYYRSGMRINLLDKEELREAFAAVGVEEGSDVILYCQKSHRACTVYLALERLRYRSVRVYPGSFREWSRASHLPVVRTPAQRA